MRSRDLRPCVAHLWLMACTPAAEHHDTQAPPSDSSGAPTTTDAPGTTAATGCDGPACNPVPEGWEGPVALASASDPATLPACTTPFSGDVTDLFEGWHEPGPASCTCTCELTEEPFCFGWVAHSPELGCVGFSNTTDVTHGCFDIAFASTFFYAADPGETMCDEHVVAEVPTIAWDQAIRLCDAEPEAGCDSAACDPPPGFETAACIHADGDLACPAGAYQERRLLYAGVDDTRGCSGCTCPDRAPTCIGAQLAIYPEPGCVGEPTTIPPGDPCRDVGGASLETVYTPMPEIAPIASTQPSGTATPRGPITLCCAS